MTSRRPEGHITPEQEARFDAELARAARALVTEDLPRGVLDHGLAPWGGLGGVRARRPLPAYAGLSAVLVVLLATAVALVPGGAPAATSTPVPLATIAPPPPSEPGASPASSSVEHGTFRSTAEIRADLERLRYACRVGNELLPTGPSPSAPIFEGAICEAPADAGPYIAAVIVLEAADGRPVELHVKANLTGEATEAARDEIAVPLAKAVAIAASGEGVGNELAAWVLEAVPLLAPSTANSTKLLGFGVKILRDSSGGFQLIALGG